MSKFRTPISKRVIQRKFSQVSSSGLDTWPRLQRTSALINSVRTLWNQGGAGNSTPIAPTPVSTEPVVCCSDCVLHYARTFCRRTFTPNLAFSASYESGGTLRAPPIMPPIPALSSNLEQPGLPSVQASSQFSTNGSDEQSYAPHSTHTLSPRPNPSSRVLDASLRGEPRPPLKVRRARNLHFPTRESLDSLSLTAVHLQQARSHLEDLNITPRPHGSKWASDSQPGQQSDTVRRYHALMELLRTEAKYLLDLRTLVTIYLQHLPMATATVKNTTTSYFGGPTSSSTSGSPVPIIFMPPSLSMSGAPIMIRRRSRSINEMDNEKLSQRPLFSPEEITLLSRNAKDLLYLHDRFVEQLKEVVAPFGSLFAFGSKDDDDYWEFPTEECLDRVVVAVTSQFTQQSDSFEIYQFFCSNHTEAYALVQSKQKQNPVEWATWENKCRRTVENMHRTESVGHVRSSSSSSYGSNESTEYGGEIKRPESSHPSSYTFVPNRQRLAGGTRRQSSRLGFTDYLIMPVQRICRYHLLLSQLHHKRPSSENPEAETNLPNSNIPLQIPSTSIHADQLVSIASNAMRAVVGSVNDDRRRHEYEFKSALVASRMSTSLIPLDFIQSLGACLLVGALDVVYHRPTSSNTIKAKYLGTFLYADGYIVMTKVAKTKVYDPTHWFSLSGFEVADQEDDDPGFPYSFHLTGRLHHFQLAASCQKEKQAWMEGFREAIKSAQERPLDHTSSLRDENREEVEAPPNALSGQKSMPQQSLPLSQLPTIESLPELESDHTTTVQSAKHPTTPKAVNLENAPLAIRRNSTVKDLGTSLGQSTSRISSTASVKAIFYPLLFESGTRIGRSSTLHRQQVDQGLDDVFSDLCRDARSQAGIQCAELFQVTKRAPPVPRSNKVAGIRPKHDGILVARRSYTGTGSPAAAEKVPRKQKTLSDLSCTGSWSAGGGDSPIWSGSMVLPNPEIIPDYTANPLSVCSSDETSAGSAFSSPGEPILSVPCPIVSTQTRPVSLVRPASSSGSESGPSRSQSMVGSFRSLFSARSSASSAEPNPLPPTPPRSEQIHDVSIPGVPRRQRTQSTPTPVSLYKAAKPGTHTENTIPHAHRDKTTTLSPRKKLSLLHPYARHDSPVQTSDSTIPVRRKSFKDILHHIRSHSFTPIST